VAGTVSFNSAHTVATFHPGEPAGGRGHVPPRRCRGAQNASGTPMSSPLHSWSFHHRRPTCPCSIWQNGHADRVGRERHHERADRGPEVPGQQQRIHRRGAVLQGAGQSRGAYRELVVFDRDACSPTARSATRPPAGGRAGLPPPPVADHRGDDVRASYFTTTGHPRTPTRGWRRRWSHGPLTALAGGGVYAAAPGEHLPHQRLRQHQLLGRRGVLPVGGCHGAGGVDRVAGQRVDRQRGVGGADGDVFPGGEAGYGVVTR